MDLILLRICYWYEFDVDMVFILDLVEYLCWYLYCVVYITNVTNFKLVFYTLFVYAVSTLVMTSQKLLKTQNTELQKKFFFGLNDLNWRIQKMDGFILSIKR